MDKRASAGDLKMWPSNEAARLHIQVYFISITAPKHTGIRVARTVLVRPVLELVLCFSKWNKGHCSRACKFLCFVIER